MTAAHKNLLEVFFSSFVIFLLVARLQPGVQGADDGQDWGLHPLLQHAGGPQPRQV